jgi:hypothetical protein
VPATGRPILLEEVDLVIGEPRHHAAILTDFKFSRCPRLDMAPLMGGLSDASPIALSKAHALAAVAGTSIPRAVTRMPLSGTHFNPAVEAGRYVLHGTVLTGDGCAATLEG